jgi:hypothetical protein
MGKRKPVLIFDGSSDSAKAIGLLRKNGIEFVEYDVSKFAESCCCGDDDLPTTKAPSVFAPEGVFKGLDGVKEYITTITTAVSSREANVLEKKDSESAYW